MRERYERFKLECDRFLFFLENLKPRFLMTKNERTVRGHVKEYYDSNVNRIVEEYAWSTYRGIDKKEVHTRVRRQTRAWIIESIIALDAYDKEKTPETQGGLLNFSLSLPSGRIKLAQAMVEPIINAQWEERQRRRSGVL